MNENIIQAADAKYYVKNPDSNFSPERNKAIINETIKETEQFFDSLVNGDDKELEERVDVITSYGRYRFNKGTKELKNYLGPKMYQDLIGERLLNKVRAVDSLNKLGPKKILI